MFSIRLKANRENFCVIKEIVDKTNLPKPTIYLADRVIFYWDKLVGFPLDNEKLSAIIKGSLFVDCYFHDIQYGYTMVCEDGEQIFWREADNNSRKNRLFLAKIRKNLVPTL